MEGKVHACSNFLCCTLPARLWALSQCMCSLRLCVQILSYREAEQEDRVIAEQQAAAVPPVLEDDNVEFASPPCLLMLCTFPACSVSFACQDCC